MLTRGMELNYQLADLRQWFNCSSLARLGLSVGLTTLVLILFRGTRILRALFIEGLFFVASHQFNSVGTFRHHDRPYFRFSQMSLRQCVNELCRPGASEDRPDDVPPRVR
jgi:hypothetical protein